MLVATSNCDKDADGIMIGVVSNVDEASVVLYFEVLAWLELDDNDVLSTKLNDPDATDIEIATSEGENRDVIRVIFSLFGNDVEVRY